jgi:hypothetical protein
MSPTPRNLMNILQQMYPMKCGYSVACIASSSVCMWLPPLWHYVSLHTTIIRLGQNSWEEIAAIHMEKAHEILQWGICVSEHNMYILKVGSHISDITAM